MDPNQVQQVQMAKSQVILVDENDLQVGTCDKYGAHRTNPAPKLHRAFSLFLFDSNGRLLLQRRSSYKLTFPLIWANTCCSHPEPNEEIIPAALRRVKFELNLETEKITDLREIGVFLYQAPWGEWTEYEIDHVVFGFYEIEKVDFNTNEVIETKWVTSDELTSLVENQPDTLSPWLKKIYAQWLIPNWKKWVADKTLVQSSTEIVRL
ncbi:isopentenyl-diphosphate delta-isomerase, type 1 family protein [Tritrichomonas foetus]|uniref:isopentenyl-diphosphate Delta-isomerase n=1 Tax=Tritrichomonas foetus TaxID=1144522 RepID=A0A1J4KAH4_9EUKA|nr:isopentenyl-diphosphate delta-isomerase, type 1 family protein [Tritrichomonas foetus]|eukprot:OHT08219.1 isopentenyl-diphosphate delta-isomerase, type 1 family protein [Tritrichomonas foetus]